MDNVLKIADQVEQTLNVFFQYSYVTCSNLSLNFIFIFHFITTNKIFMVTDFFPATK